jgi:hypothetical protein
MIKKVATFSTHYDGKKILNIYCKHLHIFNPNSKYSSPENYVRDKIKQISSDKDIDMQNCKIHFLHHCTVPRNKIKDFCDANKIKVTRDVSKADYLIFSDQTISKSFDRNWYYKITTAEFINYLNSGRTHSRITNEQYDYILDEINNSEYKDKVLVDYSVMRFINDVIRDSSGVPTKLSSEGFYYSDDDKICEIINTLETNNFVHQDYILQKLNSSNVIDEAVYKSLTSLLESTDESNQCIAMEIMANSDYNKSAYHLLLLFRDYQSKFFYSKFKNHVNFKALMNYFSVTLNRYLSDDDIISKMKSKKLFTKKYYDLMSEEYVSRINQYMERGHFQFFGVKSKDVFFLNVDIDPEIETEEPCLNLETQMS